MYPQASPIDPVMILGILAAIMLCIVCACTAFACGGVIGYALNIMFKNNAKTAKRKPVYQQVAADESEQQV